MEHLGSSSLSPSPCTVPSLLAVPKTDPVQVLAGVSNESKSQVLDFIQLQSNVNIFAAKYPGANIICGVELEGSNEFRWQTYGPQAANPEVRKIILPLAENEIRTHRRGGTGSPSCKYHIIKSFIDAAALAGVIAGVQVTLLLELAMKLCDSESIRTEGPSGRGADPLSGVPAGPMDSMSQFLQLAALRTSPTATPTPTTTSTKGPEGGSAKKPRFTPEQAASLVEAIQQHYVQHPSRYTELVIKDMKEQYPGIDLDSAAVRKFKFKIFLKHSRNEGDSDSNRLDSGRNQLGTGEGTRSQDTPRKKSRVDVLECKALDAADGLVGLGMEEGHEMTNISGPEVLGRDKDTNYGASGMETQRLEFLSRAAEECDPTSTSQGGTRGGDPSKRKRLSPEQMAALIACVKEHVVKCPERYTQVVMKEMTDRFPGLELNMGQIRKVKFRALGNQRRGGAQDEGELTDGGLEASTSALEGIPYNHLAGLGLGELKPSGQFSQGSLLQYKDLETFLLHANPHLGLGLCNISLPPNVHSLTQALTLLPGGPGPLETNPVPLLPLSTCHQAMQEGPIEMSTHQGNGQQQEPYGESPVRGFPPSPAACGEADGSGFRRASLSQDVDVDALDNQHCEADVAQLMT